MKGLAEGSSSYKSYAIAPSRKTVICFLLLLLIIHLSYLPGSLSFHLPFLPAISSSCHGDVPPVTPDPSGAVAQVWKELQTVFEKHSPNKTMERKDFPGGQTVQTTVELLAGHLDISLAEAKEMRTSHANMVEGLPPYPKGAFQGQGIVMLAGGRYSEYAATALGMLRLLGSRLPVEVWMIDRIEEKQGWCGEVARQGVVCRFITDYIDDGLPAISEHYQLKVLALLFSSFAEILYLDSDSVPVVNPDRIFDTSAYKRTGAILWPDYWGLTESPYTAYITGRSAQRATTKPNFQTVDSGQMLWNKEKHWKVSIQIENKESIPHADKSD